MGDCRLALGKSGPDVARSRRDAARCYALALYAEPDRASARRKLRALRSGKKRSPAARAGKNLMEAKSP